MINITTNKVGKFEMNYLIYTTHLHLLKDLFGFIYTLLDFIKKPKLLTQHDEFDKTAVFVESLSLKRKSLNFLMGFKGSDIRKET